MTRGRPVEPDRLFEHLARRAGLSALVAGAACTLLAVIGGTDAVVGAAAGTAVVAVFYGVDLCVVRATRGMDPEATRAVVLGEYLLKIVLLGGFVWWLHKQSWVQPEVLAVTVIVVTVVWLVAMMVVALRTRAFLYDAPAQPGPAADPGTGSGPASGTGDEPPAGASGEG